MIIEADETFIGTAKRAQWSFVNGVGWFAPRRRRR